MAQAEYVPAHKLEPGDLIADPRSGTKYAVEAVNTEGKLTEISYVKNNRGALGVTVKSKRIMTRWRTK
jgi:hypothetical protein